MKTHISSKIRAELRPGPCTWGNRQTDLAQDVCLNTLGGYLMEIRGEGFLRTATKPCLLRWDPRKKSPPLRERPVHPQAAHSPPARDTQDGGGWRSKSSSPKVLQIPFPPPHSPGSHVSAKSPAWHRRHLPPAPLATQVFQRPSPRLLRRCQHKHPHPGRKQK